ncbi:MAG: type II/IV secretion system protein, partial [Proteobacteria bacterium]
LILPIEVREGTLVLAVNNPIDVEMLDLVGRVLKMPIHLNISSRPQLIDVIEAAFAGKTAVDTLVENLRRQDTRGKAPRPPGAPLRLEPSAGGEASIETLVNRFLEQGVRELASDIHIDPATDGSRVRMRIDGILHEMHRYPNELHGAIISRLKVLSGLDIAEKRNAQDGRFQYQFLNHEVDVRISTVPTIRGEKGVLRLLNKRKQTLSLKEVGMPPDLVQEISDLVNRPYGIVFVTGPTGSGKTTSLYSMLQTLNGVERNIVTVEDPVEFTFDLINQIQVNEKAGVTFPNILRSILRQDPDVMMIGEVRDAETASIAVQAALTGHLVLSTLHTNGAVSAISRLVDMKIEPFLLSSSLLAVLAQRLVRRLCLKCRKPKEAEAK